MAINSVVFDNIEQEVASSLEITDLLTKLKCRLGRELSLADSDGFEMHVAHVPKFGFYVSTLSGADRERIASDRSLPKDRVTVVIADEQEVPRSILISEELAERIVREFFETGRRSSIADWLDPFEVIK